MIWMFKIARDFVIYIFVTFFMIALWSQQNCQHEIAKGQLSYCCGAVLLQALDKNSLSVSWNGSSFNYHIRVCDTLKEDIGKLIDPVQWYKIHSHKMGRLVKSLNQWWRVRFAHLQKWTNQGKAMCLWPLASLSGCFAFL